MATIISSKTSGVGGLAVTGDSSGILQLASADGTTAVTIDASQNVGIGTSSLASKFTIVQNQAALSYLLDTYNTTNGGSSIWRMITNNIANSGATSVDFYKSSGSGFSLLNNDTNAANFTAFGLGGAERMRIDASGNLLVGTTSALTVGTTSGSGFEVQSSGLIIQNIANAAACRYVTKTAGGTTNTYFDSFYVGATNVGYIISPSGTTILYTSVSDYRLKENVQPMTGALNLVSQLKPCSYTWKSDGSSSDGFIAHELQEVFPQAVSGVKDAVDAEGNPQYQGVDTSFLVATLTCAIQELKAIIDLQQTQITALNAKVGI